MILLSELTMQIVVVDALDSTSATSALSANQGRVLDEAIGALETDVGGLQTDVTALQSGKADTSHTHEIADVTGLQDALDNISVDLSQLHATALSF